MYPMEQGVSTYVPPARAAMPPGPRAPAVAQAISYARDPIGRFVRLRESYGDIFSVSFPGFGRVVYVAEPGLVKRVFTGDPDTFHAGEANATVLEPAVGPNSVLTLDGAEHLRQRKLLLPPFHGESIQRYGRLIREIAERDMGGWPVGEAFPLRPHTQAITLQVILRAVFGVRGRDRLRRAMSLTKEFAARANVITQFPFLRRSLGSWSPWSRFLRSRQALDEFLYEEIALRRDAPADGGRDDVLSLLLAATHEDGSPLSDRELRDELVTVVGAGHETTATALAWAMERLLRTPRALAALRESLSSGDDYLIATVKETLRMRPVIADVARRLTADADVGGYILPAGTLVLPAIAAIHHRPDLYPEPFEFRPERFLDGTANHYAWIPFGGGIRRCVGAAFAEYEMRVVLRAFLERADLAAPDPRPERPKLQNITLAPAKGGRVILERVVY
jgi:cytochrome P450 family 135